MGGGCLPEAGLGVSPDALSAMARKAGIRKLLSTSATGLTWDYQVGNEETMVAATAHNDILPVATIDPRGYHEAQIHALADKGCVAVRLFPESHGYDPTNVVCQAVLTECSELLPVMVETRRRGTISRLAEVTQSMPGRFILVGVTEDLLMEALHVLARGKVVKGPEFYLETSGLYSKGGLEMAVKHAGADHVLFGSGAPVVPPGCAITNIKNADIDDAAREAIFSGNAEKLFSEAAH